MSNIKDYDKFLAYTFDEKNTDNPIIPTNYIDKNFDYNAKDLWIALSNLSGFGGRTDIKTEIRPVQQYIIKEYRAELDLLETIHKLADSYVRNLDPDHMKLICESVEYGRTLNSVNLDDTLEKGLYNRMLKYFGSLIADGSQSKWGVKLDHNRECEEIYVINMDVFKKIEDLLY